MPILCQLAELYLGMASSSIPVECLLSSAALIANGKRASLKPYILEHILLVHDNFELARDRFFAHSLVETVEHYLETVNCCSLSRSLTLNIQTLRY